MEREKLSYYMELIKNICNIFLNWVIDNEALISEGIESQN